VVTGFDHTCLITTTLGVKCFGENFYGTCGYGHMNDTGDEAFEMGVNLLDVDLGTSFESLGVTGMRHSTCARSTNGLVKCWGRNNNGQLGLGLTSGNHKGGELGEMGDYLPTAPMGSFHLYSIDLINC